MGSQRYEALDSWRGLCALLVALFHFPVLSAVSGSDLVRHSYLFVDFFFVLSGFIITVTQTRRPDDFGRFMLKRFARIWPLHVAMLGVFLAVSLAQGDFNSDERHSALAVVSNLLMIHAWGIHNDLTWNDPSWSISVEWALYLLFAVFAWALSERVKAWAYAGLVLGGIGSLFFFAPSGMGSTFDFGLARGLAGFFMGCLIARSTARPMGTIAELMAVLGVVVFVASGVAPYIATFVFGAAVYVFANSNGVFKRALEAKPLVWLGDRSYAIYMVHAVFVAVLWAVGRKFGWGQVGGRLDVGAWGDLMAMGYLAVIVLAAWSVAWFENGARRYIIGASKPRIIAAE